MTAIRVLIVEDDTNSRSALVELLGEEGYLTKGVATGAEALESATAATPDIALVDYGLPDINGLQVISGIRERAPDCRIVLLSGTAELLADDAGEYVFSNHADEARARGAVDYLPKPVDIDLLLATLERLS
jgi:CheY-like chemotaxis protein